MYVCAGDTTNMILYIYDGVSLYMVHIILQYATDVKNLIIKNLRLRFWGENKNATSLH